MEQFQNSFSFKGTASGLQTGDDAAQERVKTGSDDVILDKSVCRLLDEYVHRYAGDDTVIELKGKLIRYIRGI